MDARSFHFAGSMRAQPIRRIRSYVPEKLSLHEGGEVPGHSEFFAVRNGVGIACAMWFAWVFAGIRDVPSCFKRCPCAGRHLLFFAAAKKSR
ncbi:MAG: hypothetical protein ACN6QC_12565, partial [Paraburkholderia hospita]